MAGIDFPLVIVMLFLWLIIYVTFKHFPKIFMPWWVCFFKSLLLALFITGLFQVFWRYKVYRFQHRIIQYDRLTHTVTTVRKVSRNPILRKYGITLDEE